MDPESPLGIKANSFCYLFLQWAFIHPLLKSISSKKYSFVCLGIEPWVLPVWWHRHLREIDCSLAVVGGLATGAECGANQYTCHPYGAKKCFIVAAAAGDITTTVNRGRWAGANKQSTYMRCLWVIVTSVRMLTILTKLWKISQLRRCVVPFLFVQ